MLDQESMKIENSVNSLSNNLILNNLSRYNISYDNTSGEMKMLNNSKDISINDCLKLTDPNLSSIDQSYLLKSNELGLPGMFKYSNDNKENHKEYSNLLKPTDNSYTFDSNQSMEM